MSHALAVQFLILGAVLGLVAGWLLPGLLRQLARLAARLLPSRHLRFHPRRRRRGGDA